MSVRPVPVPLLDLKPQYAALREEIRRVTDEVYESQGFILGPRVQAFEEAVASYVGARYAVGMSSGTDALLAAMMALGVGPGDDVVTTPYSFFATAGVVARLGARPVFCDIEPATYGLDPARLEAAITPKTKAIQPVHLYGQCADMDAILAIARARSIPVVEDACQSLSAAYRGVKAGALGELGCFSFFPSKNLGAFGDAGLVTTSDEALATLLRALRMHGETSRYHHRIVGGNFRLDALQAAILQVKLPHLDGWSDARRRNRTEIEGLFRENGGRGYDDGGLGFPVEAEGRHHVYNQLVLRVARGRRDELRRCLDGKQIGQAVYYPVPLHLQECFGYLGYREGDFPEAEKAAKETVAIPVFPELTAGQKAYLAATLADFSRQ